jgi:hypothetical protein
MQRRGELPGERAAIEAQLTELHHRKSALETEQAITVDLTNARARAKDVTTAINRERVQCPAFARASLNLAAAAALLVTLTTSSIDRANKVYRQLKDILIIATAPQAESCLQRRAELSVSTTGPSKASWQKPSTKLPMVRTASSTARILACVLPSHPDRHQEPQARRQAHRGDKGTQSVHSRVTCVEVDAMTERGAASVLRDQGPRCPKATCVTRVSQSISGHQITSSNMRARQIPAFD